MQEELTAAYPVLRIRLLGVNGVGQEAGNATATENVSIPWLQDVDANGNGRADVALEVAKWLSGRERTSWSETHADVIHDGNTNLH